MALSNLAVMFLTAWLLRCAALGRSPVPSLPGRVNVENDNGDEVTRETEPVKGRQVL